MTSVRIGFTATQIPTSAGHWSTDVIELKLTSRAIKSNTLRRWRRDLPREVHLIAVLPDTALSFVDQLPQFENSLVEALLRFATGCAALKANAVTFNTPLMIPPGPRGEERLRVYFELLRQHLSLPLIWQPAGLWERDDATRLAQRCQITCSYNPITEQPCSSPIGYGRIPYRGRHTLLTEPALEQLAETLQTQTITAAPHYLIIEGPRGPTQAARLRAMVHTSSELSAGAR